MSIRSDAKLVERIEALEREIQKLKASLLEQKSPKIAAPHVANGQRPTLGLRSP